MDKFDTGSQRDTENDKPRPDLFSPYADERVGRVLKNGADYYGERNWEKGIPISRCISSLERHLMYYKMGKRDEDHMANLVCNAMFIIHYEEMIRMRRMPDTINDMPNYDGDRVIYE